MPTKAHKAAGARLCRAFAFAWARLLLPLLLLSFEAGAATWYVRPASGEYGAEDGTSYATAFDGTADITWGVSGVNAGDTLCVDGTFTGASESDVSGITLRIDQSGSAGNVVTVDGDCDGDGIKAEFDGDNAVGIAIRTAIVGTSRTTYLAVKNIVMRQYTNKAVVNYNVTGDSTADANQTWTGIEIYDHGDGGTADNCFDSRGRYITLNDSYIDGCDEDAVYHQGKYFRSDGLTVRNFSRANANGDGLQLAGEQDGYHVSNFDCEHAADTKQCFINSVSTDTAANGIFEDFNVRCMPGATVTNCVFVGGTGVQVRRGFISGGNYGLAIEGDADSANMVVESIIQRGATIDGIGVFTSAGAGNVIRNVYAIDNGRHGIFLATTSAGTVINSVATGNGSCGINRADAGQTESYNDAHGNGINFCSGSVSTTAGTGSISADPQFIGGANPTTAEGFRLSASSPLIGAGTDLGDEIADHFGDLMYDGKWDIGAFRRDSCYRRSRDGKLDMARTRAQVVSRCRGIPGRYPEGL